MQPCQGQPGWDTVDYSLPEGTLKTGVLHPLIWSQLAALPLKTKGHGQGWNPVPAAAARVQDGGGKCSPTLQKMYFLLLPFLPSILAFCPPALFLWLLHSLQLGQDRNFPVAVETQMKDTLQTKMPNKKWLCVSPDGCFSLPGCVGFEALLWGTLYRQGGL